jgi:tellurite resistance protein TerC
MADWVPWAALAAATVFFLWVDLHFFARGRQPAFSEAVKWSIGWLVLGLLAAVVVFAVDDAEAAITYTTVYFIERSLSLDNLFVFLLLFAYFRIPHEQRATLLFIGIALALVMRGLAILGGVALLERFHWVIYILGGLLIVLAWRILRGVDESVDPEKTISVRVVRRIYPNASTWALCLSAIVAADIAFAIDSIPAAFGITREATLIWMGNIFALLGLRALFVLVEELIRRFRYLDQTIAIILGLVGMKLLVEEWVKVGAVASLAVVFACFTVGIGASIWADRRDRARGVEPEHERERSPAEL